MIKIAQLRAGTTDGADRASADLEPDYIVQNGDILFSWSGSLECVVWAAGRGALNQHLFKVTSDRVPEVALLPRRPSPPRRLSTHRRWEGNHDGAHSAASSVGCKAGNPFAGRLLTAMDVVFAPIVESTWRRAVEARTLATLRDALLPKLISGELQVKDAERFVGATV